MKKREKPSGNRPATYVAESPIHGKGLFADRPFLAGQTVIKIEYKPTRSLRSPYIAHVEHKGKKIRILMTNDAKYVNHDENPNVAWSDDDEFVAIRSIAKGDEITWDYGEDWI